MGEVKEVTLEALAERFDDVQDGHRSLSARINEYQGRLEKQNAETHQRIVNELNEALADLRRELRQQVAEMNKQLRQQLGQLNEQFVAKVRERIHAVTSDEIAEALTRKILVVRNATRDELNSPDVLKVRQATLGEIHNRQN